MDETRRDEIMDFQLARINPHGHALPLSSERSHRLPQKTANCLSDFRSSDKRRKYSTGITPTIQNFRALVNLQVTLNVSIIDGLVLRLSEAPLTAWQAPKTLCCAPTQYVVVETVVLCGRDPALLVAIFPRASFRTHQPWLLSLTSRTTVGIFTSLLHRAC